MIVRGIDVDVLVEVVAFFRSFGSLWSAEAARLEDLERDEALREMRLADQYGGVIEDVVFLLTDEGLDGLRRSGAAGTAGHDASEAAE